MTKRVGLVLVAAVFLLIGLTAFGFAQNRISGLEGWKPYTPTRLEWIAVELNASLRTELSADRDFSMDFIPHETEDAILIYVDYLPSVNREIMNMHVNAARNVIAMKAKSYGWSSWLKVKERVEMKKLK